MEAVRRILNVSECQPWSEVVKHLNDFSNCMRISGYSHTERYHAISGAIERVNTMRAEVANGERCSIFRDKNQIIECKISKKDWSNTWYLKGDISNTVSCPITPGGVLRKELTKSLNSQRGENNRILVIEDGGRPIHVGLKVRDPHRLDGCVFGQEACPVVSGTDCDRTGVVYKIECKQCKETAENVNSVHNYIGLTRSSLHSRMQSHLARQRRQQNHNPLFRHNRDHH